MDKKTVIEFCKKNQDKEFLSPKGELVFSLWPHGEIEELNKGYGTDEYIPGYFGFGSDGGNEMLVANLVSGKVFYLPMIPMEEKSAVEISGSLGGLLLLERK